MRHNLRRDPQRTEGPDINQQQGRRLSRDWHVQHQGHQEHLDRHCHLQHSSQQRQPLHLKERGHSHRRAELRLRAFLAQGTHRSLRSDDKRRDEDAPLETEQGEQSRVAACAETSLSPQHGTIRRDTLQRHRPHWCEHERHNPSTPHGREDRTRR